MTMSRSNEHLVLGGGPRYPHIMRAVYARPWAILPGTLALVVDILQFRVAGGRMTEQEIEARVEAASKGHGPRGGKAQEGFVARIPVYGVISQRQNLMAADSGGTSIEGITQDFRQAMADPEVLGVVFDIDSPGGTIDGVEELASEIRAARGGAKPIVAQADTMAASAAYWIAAACDEVIVAPSGSVGSIGIFTAHEDLSVAAEAEGVKTTLISAGKYKTEGNPWEPLGEEARANLQDMVDQHYSMFVSAVAKGRGVAVSQVRGGYGQGRLVLAKQAVAEGMADRIDTLDGTERRIAAGRVQSRPAGQPAASAHPSTLVAAGAILGAPGGVLGNDTTQPEQEPVPAPALGDRIALVSAQAEELLEHASNRAEMRARIGRGLSPGDRAGLRSVAVTLQALAGDEPETEAPGEPEPSAAWAAAARNRLALARAEHDF